MTDSSARFHLPFILPGQAQKEAFHNEALTLLDAALQACVNGDPTDEIPEHPAPGESWLVAPGGTGEWAGKAGNMATWSEGGWRFTAPVPGMTVWNTDSGYWLHWTGVGWSGGEWPVAALTIGGVQVVGSRLEMVSSPSGGTIIDAEARVAIESIIVALRTHGLTE